MRTFVAAVAAFLACGGPAWAEAGKRPNILWITSEDIGPHLGCYGDALRDHAERRPAGRARG